MRVMSAGRRPKRSARWSATTYSTAATMVRPSTATLYWRACSAVSDAGVNCPSATRERSITSRATVAPAAGWTMASRGASLLAGCGWMTPLRVPFSQSLALALLRQPSLPRRRRGSNGTKCVRRSVRTVIHEVIADIDTDAAEIVLLIHWVDGVHTEIRLPRRRRAQRTSTSADVIAAVRQLVLIANDDLIAGILNRNGLVTGYGNRWTRERVT